jgi:predicted dehydrogenase
MGLKMGIVGSGAMAEYHAKRFSGLADVSIAAVCDHLPSEAERFARSFGVPLRFSDPEAMLASGEVDALAIASYDGAHASAAIAALSLGIPVFCEKPMARRLGEAEAMASAARRAAERGAAVPAIVNFSKRNGGLLAAAAAVAAEGRLGRILGVELRYLQSWLLQDAWGDWRTTPRWKWRLAEGQSTYGALGDLGSHLFDSALLLAGAETGASAPADGLEPLSCEAIRFVPGAEGEIEGPASFESFEARLAIGSVEVSAKAGWRFPGCLDEFAAQLVCERGRIEIAPGRSRSSVRIARASGETVDIEVGRSESTYERFAGLAMGGPQPGSGSDPDFERGLAVQRAIAGCARLAGADPE